MNSPPLDELTAILWDADFPPPVVFPEVEAIDDSLEDLLVILIWYYYF